MKRLLARDHQRRRPYALAACGTDDGDSGSAAAANTKTASVPDYRVDFRLVGDRSGSAPTVGVTEIEELGDVLTDAAGRVLYVSDEEAADPTGSCAPMPARSSGRRSRQAPKRRPAPPASPASTSSSAPTARCRSPTRGYGCTRSHLTSPVRPRVRGSRTRSTASASLGTSPSSTRPRRRVRPIRPRRRFPPTAPRRPLAPAPRPGQDRHRPPATSTTTDTDGRAVFAPA